MGYDLHITRADEWFDSGSTPIGLEEWLAVISNDPTLSLMPENGVGFAFWKGSCQYGDGTWFDWNDGGIFTKNPDGPILAKMLQLAAFFNATVQGDDCEVYEDDSDQSVG